jgi:hypothetical protein
MRVARLETSASGQTENSCEWPRQRTSGSGTDREKVGVAQTENNCEWPRQRTSVSVPDREHVRVAQT